MSEHLNTNGKKKPISRKHRRGGKTAAQIRAEKAAAALKNLPQLTLELPITIEIPAWMKKPRNK